MASQTPSLPPVATLRDLDAIARAEILDLLFEPCTQLHTLSVTPIAETTFSTYANLIAFVGTQLTGLRNSDLESDQKWLNAILGAHPRLGEKKVDSALSRQEQAAMNAAESRASSNDQSQAEAEAIAERLAGLNERYEEAFPGLRYVTFVNGRPRSVIMDDMQRRIDRADLQQEKIDAIQAMCDIAQDRAKKLGTV